MQVILDLECPKEKEEAINWATTIIRDPDRKRARERRLVRELVPVFEGIRVKF